MNGVSALGALVALLSITALAWACQRLTRSTRIPPVFALLGIGMAARQLFPYELISTSSPSTTSAPGLPSSEFSGIGNFLKLLSQPLVDVSLGAMGIEIASHVNQSSFGGLSVGAIVKFFGVFMMTTWLTMCIGLRSVLYLFGWDQLILLVPVVSSIALERSSPEALQGVRDARAKGPFSTALMCIAAMQDVLALVLFVVSSIVLGATSPKDGVVHLVLMLLSTAAGAALTVGVLSVTKSIPPVLALVSACGALAVWSHWTHAELLLSAVMAGVYLQFEKPMTSLSAATKAVAPFTSTLLFTWMGYRIDVLSYLYGAHADRVTSHLAAAALTYAVRVASLTVGCVAGGAVAGPSSIFGGPASRYRSLALVTQLAIALLLVGRGEEMHPEGAVLFRSFGGSILLALLTGPMLLQLSLRWSGETGKAPLVVAMDPVGNNGSAEAGGVAESATGVEVDD